MKMAVYHNLKNLDSHNFHSPPNMRALLGSRYSGNHYIRNLRLDILNCEM